MYFRLDVGIIWSTTVYANCGRLTLILTLKEDSIKETLNVAFSDFTPIIYCNGEVT